jgi:hypothetical protein
MNVIRKAVSALGGVFLAALLLSALAPKATRAIAAALVQIVPGSTTHVGQNESSLVSLFCTAIGARAACFPVDSSGNIDFTAGYTVPTGSTLVITDYEYFTSEEGAPAGKYICDTLLAQLSSTTQGILLPREVCAVADQFSNAYGKEHFTTGVRVASGATIQDLRAQAGFGQANIQGYLVPND